VQKVAPYLKVDSDPYPFVDPSNGHIMWMVDGYTTMDNFPYSQRQSLSSLTDDSLAASNKTAKQPDDEINYIRNSVKATVDAYTGKVTLYQWDAKDPVLKAWMQVFPGTVHPVKDMPKTVRAHVRYPEDLFEVQRSLLGTYHVDNPVQFYNVGDKWTVPADPNASTGNQPPYYVLASDPGKGTSAPEFQLTTPMIVNSKQNLAAYISVDSDYGKNYGKFTVLKVPTSAVSNGPEQVKNILNSNSTITKDLSLFNSTGGGSTVVYGNLLTLPLGNSFLYVEPLYVQAAGGNGSFPTLARVLVTYGNKGIGYGPNLGDALLNLNQDSVGLNIGNGSATTPTTPSPTSSSSPTPTGSSTAPGGSSTTPTVPATGATLDQKLASAYADLKAAVASGNKTAVTQAVGRINQLAGSYLETAGPSSNPVPSKSAGSPSPSK
jgi:uncharacterized membrane protein (UPF0182 family)